MESLRIFYLSLVLLGLLGAPFSSQAVDLSTDIPLTSPIYSELDKLSGLGFINTSLQAIRPFSRIEAARQVLEARQQASARETTPVVDQLLGQLERELRDQLLELSELEGVTAHTYIKPLRDLRTKLVFQDGEPSVFSGTAARQFSLNYNNSGIDYANQTNVEVSFATEAKIASFFLLDIRPLLEVQEGEGSDLRLLSGKAALSLGPFEVSAGRQSLWWGQGRHGSLILTNNAKPLDMLRITNPSPMVLPWVFEYLGPFRFDLFWSRLEDERFVPEPYFAGLRFSFKPIPWLELGASRTVIFGGDGRPDVKWEDFFTILVGKNLKGDEDNSNQLAAIDARLRLPFLWGTELYFEEGGEDEAGSFISNRSFLYGLFLPQIEPTGRASLRVEYADLSHIDKNSPPWYHHGTYLSGYTYKGKILGHHVGGAAEDIFTELKIIFPDDFTLSLELDYEKRGYDQPEFEKHLQPACEISWWATEKLRLSGRYALDSVENFLFQPGQNETFHLAFLNLDLIL